MTADHGPPPPLDRDARAVVAALAGLERMTAHRLRSLLNRRTPRQAWDAVRAGDDGEGAVAEFFRRDPSLAATWSTSANDGAVEQMACELDRLGVEVLLPGDASWPTQLAADPRRPAALFVTGDASVLDARRVAIVGTRRPTQRGVQTAVRFGHELAVSGVVVISGLAKGVDGAAHRGVLGAGGAPPVAIVANGHDAPYPRQHRALWSEVATAGAVISEWPPGVRPEAFRFPQRNRIIAALAEVVVVVESRERGGSLITAREAAERGVEVLAVPGPVDTRACAGTNALLRDGAGLASEPDDVFVALGLDSRRAHRRHVELRPPPTGPGARVVDRCRRGPATIDQLVADLGIDVVEAARAVGRLERDGWLVEFGGWFEYVDEWGAPP